MALWPRETHRITLKNLALFRPKQSNFFSANQIAGFVNYYCDGVKVIEFSIWLKNWKHSHGTEIWSLDSIIIPLMIEENRAKFLTVSSWVPLEQGLPQGYKGLIVISLVRFLKPVADMQTLWRNLTSLQGISRACMQATFCIQHINVFHIWLTLLIILVACTGTLEQR